ncbi:YitT family protein [Paludibacter sp. 221]|uniref:YitT family protein n=1 Tax=Paludibacter sp. 221 TaxID=2302939 RepID=UPI00351BCA8C
MKPKQYLKIFYWKDYLNITIGLLAYAVGLIGFIRPVGVVTGGLTGISLLVEYATGGSIPIQYTYFAVNAILLIVALKVLGFKFLIKTIYSVLVLTFLLTLMQKIITKPIVENEPLMSALIGGMMCGAGIGFVFNANGSTGGTDVVVAIINKYKNIAFGRGMMFCDFIIICCSYFVFHDFIKIVHGLIVMGVMTYTIDLVINGFRQSVQFLIFSKKYEIIADAINKELNRGCTILDGMGWYSKEPSKVIVLLAKRSEAATIFRMIKSIDENAFISQSVVRGVWGQGFDPIKLK